MFAINFVEIVGSDSIKHQLVIPLWNSSVDTDEIGNCYIINKSEGDATIQSSALTSCTVIVMSANGVTISLETPSQNGPMGLNNLVLYFERVDIANNCTSHKYGMVIKQNETCHMMFQHTKLLFSLQGSGFNRIASLNLEVFSDTPSLLVIDISGNRLREVHSVINPIPHVNLLDLRYNYLTEVTKNSFANLSILTEVFVNQQEICECYIPAHMNCTATEERSPYLTCERLLSNQGLAVMIWIIGVNALVGNGFVLVLKQISIKTSKVQDILLTNLALSDLLMGIYMLIIASADIYFGEYFPMQGEEWRSGVTCRVAGAISIISSEASVFFVTLVSVDRYSNIKFPYSNRKLKKKSTIVVSVVAWVFAFLLGTIPSVLTGLSFKFYDNSHVCIGLPLALHQQYVSEEKREKRLFDGYQFGVKRVVSTLKGYNTGIFFSSAVFLGLNGICYIFILCCYIEIIRTARKSTKSSGRNLEMKEQIKLTSKVAFIVATDFLCWFPIILLGILVQLRVIALSPAAFAWLISVVLPINSAINPYLYTIADNCNKM